MSNRRSNRGQGGQIRGPQSALTDFLASQNISARRIRADAEARRNASRANNQGDVAANEAASTAEPATEEIEAGASSSSSSTRTQTRKPGRKKQTIEAIEKIKKSKASKRRKRNLDNESDSDDLARAIFEEKSTPLPGQMENCAICEKRFTVTPYTRAGPDGGLLCTKCAKDLAKDDEPAKKKRKTGPKGAGRRKMQSGILDGNITIGSKSLVTLCIETLAKNISLADDLGELPTSAIDRISRLLSKRRLLNDRTLDLLLQPRTEDVMVYDGSYLKSDDYIRIFQTAPKLKRLKLKNAIQFKDEVMKYLMGRNLELSDFYLHGANLVSGEVWNEYLEAKGKALRGLQVYYTDKHFDNNVVASLKKRCPNLQRLKITHNQEVNDDGIEHIAELKDLEHLGLQLKQPPSTEPYVRVVNAVGKKLRTLSLREMTDVDDRLLDAIHDNCSRLSKLRISGSEIMTDSGFVRLFKDWTNYPLHFIDFQKCRQVDSAKPRENPHLVGLCSDGFRALMKHSGRHLKHLNIHACRHISREAFEDVFSLDKVYLELLKLEISFCEEVTDFVVGCIFRSCPNLRELNVFGCMKVKEVRVPRGKILVGVPNAMGMIIEGSED